jgi:hypothetical protein
VREYGLWANLLLNGFLPCEQLRVLFLSVFKYWLFKVIISLIKFEPTRQFSWRINFLLTVMFVVIA